MAGSLIKVNTATVSGTPSTLKVTGIDSTYDVYVLVAKNLIPSSDDTIGWRVTKGESIQSDSEYDNADKICLLLQVTRIMKHKMLMV